MLRSEYDKKLADLQNELEELKRVEIEEDTKFIPGNFYIGLDGRDLVLCLEDVDDGRFLGIVVGENKIGMNALLYKDRTWIKSCFKGVSDDDIKGSFKLKK